jgi:deazaflavin-dependent oxidoreductase (nitroreductase family)
MQNYSIIGDNYSITFCPDTSILPLRENTPPPAYIITLDFSSIAESVLSIQGLQENHYKREIFMAQTDFRTAVQGSNEITLTVTGRTSGRPISLPIWFTVDGNTLYLIPVKGSDTAWFKNVRKQSAIQLSAHGKTFATDASIITDQTQLDHVLETFRRKYGQNVKSYYPKYDVVVEVPLD